METEKVAASAAKKAGKGAARFAKSVGVFLGEVAAEAAERREQERESAQKIAQQTQVHIDRFGKPPLVTVSAIRKCSSSTSFWDCEDPDCYWHKEEKERRKIGTPTRNFRNSN